MRSRVVAVAGLLAVALGMAACGNSNENSNPPLISTKVSQSASPSDAPSETPAATATATPTGASTPPGTNNKSAYAWADQPAVASYSVTNAYQYNSESGGNKVARTGVGAYTVTFEKVGVAGGMAHATAYGSNNYFCNVSHWGNSGTSELVDVRCFKPDGSAADTQFVVNFAYGHQGLTRFSYAWANDKSAGDYTPSNAYRYDSTGGTAKVKRTSVGRYQVYLPASADLGGEPYSMQVTAYGASAMHCKVSATFVAAATHQVDCLKPNGAFTDSQFEITFASQGSFIGRDDRKYGEYNDVSTGVVINSGGVYTVPANDLASLKGQVIAYSEGGDSVYCHVGGWTAAGTKLNMVVRCFDFNGAPYESGFRLMISG